jgi:hypothetical protein
MWCAQTDTVRGHKLSISARLDTPGDVAANLGTRTNEGGGAFTAAHNNKTIHTPHPYQLLLPWTRQRHGDQMRGYYVSSVPHLTTPYQLQGCIALAEATGCLHSMSCEGRYGYECRATEVMWPTRHFCFHGIPVTKEFCDLPQSLQSASRIYVEGRHKDNKRDFKDTKPLKSPVTALFVSHKSYNSTPCSLCSWCNVSE